MGTISRRRFLQGAAAVGGALAVTPFDGLANRMAGAAPLVTDGYGPLVDKGDLWLPAAFDYRVVSRQGDLMSDGNPTPGIFDGMGAFPGPSGTTILIRNHENRERTGEQKVVTPVDLQWNPAAAGGNTKVVVRRRGTTYEVVESFAILGGTSTNCAGGVSPPHTWVTCEEVVKRLGGKKHGYCFEVDAWSDGPVAAVPMLGAGRMAHEAAFWHSGYLYETEDRGLMPDPGRLGTIGSCFYRYAPTTGLEALALSGERHADMDAGRERGVAYAAEWVPVPEPDHDDDTDNRLDRVAGFTPTRVQAQDNGAAYFDRLEGMWIDRGRVYFVATTGGAMNLGQLWEYDPGRRTITLIYEGTDAARLQQPDNVVIVPQTGDVLLQEDGSGEQFVRGVTQSGRIYDFAKTAANSSEFCGGCFDPDGQTLYLNQQGGRGSLPNGPTNDSGVTYAIFGPFEQRSGDRSR